MKPVDMLTLHDPANGVSGDCFRCCIASLLDLPARDVPHFCHDGDAGGGAWFRRLNEWLEPRGFTYMELAVGKGEPAAWFNAVGAEGAQMYHVLSGRSPRFPDTAHAVVALNGAIVHDPHPSRAGLAGALEDGWLIGLLIKRCGA